MLLRHYIHIVIINLNTVSRNTQTIKQSAAVSKLDWRTTIFFFDLLYLADTLRKVNMDPHIVLLGFLGDDLEIILIACIRSMRSQHKCQSVTILKCITFLISLTNPHLTAFVIAITDKTTADHRAHAGFSYRTRSLHNVHLHIIKASRATLHHLDDRKACAPICVFVSHLIFYRAYRLKEPIHK
ncbi:MAG: hypothetical protein BWY61_02172 [Firmicutes bacterium ADurb.Bin354]|nr:MAG: hypothetical protein BWY61_02172 [Firmicutes bacterium ADurb.Bin354]